MAGPSPASSSSLAPIADARCSPVFPTPARRARSKITSKTSAFLTEVVPFCIIPLAGTMWYCADYKHKEKLHHRY